ncbi:MAG: quinone-dependent dihydroorotate dehydrogenase [Leptolinea sp.]|jgi:dihydroorotate dehydrogenase|nr:quinone-dependent dihydroorotate dehydrogenase [Leptolinea sp.]
MYKTFRPLIYKLTPEQAHHTTIWMLQMAGWFSPATALVRAMYRARKNGPSVECMGLNFPNPVGMAAGYDKDGLGWRGLAALGFGHIEVGTITPKAQPGNPKPRVFRLVEDEGVINRMGFPNNGADFLAGKIKHARGNGFILGVNIGKNKITPNESAIDDYLLLTRKFAPLADYLAINVSSPNTPGLRELQSRKALQDLLQPLSAEIATAGHAIGRKVPMVVKLAPDMTDEELDGALDVIMSCGMDGVIISNTTTQRPQLRSSLANETGGLSGRPLKDLNTAMVRKVVTRTAGKLPVIASGGIIEPQDAQEKIDAGASLVQVYTGLIYTGPELVRDILNYGLK